MRPRVPVAAGAARKKAVLSTLENERHVRSWDRRLSRRCFRHRRLRRNASPHPREPLTPAQGSGTPRAKRVAMAWPSQPFVTLAAAVCSALATAPAGAAALSGLTLDPCTVVAVQMMETVDSSEARPGDFFRFETINAVTQGARVVVPARTMGYGIVAIASPAGRGGHAGTLVLEPLYLVMPNGTRVGVVLNHNTDSLESSGASDSIPGYLGAIPIPGVGAAIGVFDYFHHGKNVVVKRGTTFTIFPSDDPSVERCQDHPAY